MSKRNFESYDRDRGRNHHDGQSNFQGRPSHGGGSGGGRGRGRGRGGGGRRAPHASRSRTMTVQMNMYQLQVENRDGLAADEWVLYDVEIVDAKKKKKKGPDGEDLKPLQFEVVPKLRKSRTDDTGGESTRHLDVSRGDTPRSRRVLDQLVTNLFESDQIRLVTDFCKSAISPCRLSNFTKKIDSEIINRTANVGQGSTGVYGPADDGAPIRRAQAPQTGPYREFAVKIPSTCGDDEPDVDRVDNAYFLVRLTEVCVIPVRAFLAGDGNHVQVTDSDQVERLAQCINTMCKSWMVSTLISEGRSPRMFYLPENMQTPNLMGEYLTRTYLNNPKKCAPMVGIIQAARFCQNGNVCINVDTGLGWFDKAVVPRGGRNGDKVPVKILDDENRRPTLAGVDIGNFDRPITDINTRKDIEKKLRKLTLKVKYVRTPSPEWLDRQRDKGATESEIQRKNIYVRTNTRVADNINAFVWAADDPSLRSFTVTPRAKEGEEPPLTVTHTVASYYWERYKIRLKYPKMPIVHLKTAGPHDEYFPVEFLFQSFGKAKGADENAQLEAGLKFNDDFSASKRIDHISMVKQVTSNIRDKTGLTLSELLRQFSFSNSDEPMQIEAKVLNEPVLKFANQTASLVNGSWDLRRVRFSSPADLNSFAVIDFVGDSAKVMSNLFQVMKGHGMVLPTIGNVRPSEMLEHLTVRPRQCNPESCYQAFENALRLASDYFMRDTSGAFNRSKSWFTTRVIDKATGELSDGLVMVRNGKREIYLPAKICMATHTITTENIAEPTPARMFAIVDNDRNNPVDLFHIQNIASITCFLWVLQNGERVPEERIVNREPCIQAEDWQIECPAMIFIYLPKKEAESYNLVKMFAHFVFGVQSQCIVSETFKKQSNADQYCSNIALKCNTKLYNVCNKAHAWQVSSNQGVGVPWVCEVPTLVIGISLSHGQGQSAHTIVGGSAILDHSSCMPMAQVLKVQSKSDIVEDSIMIDIIKSLAIHFYKHQNREPQRVLIYRDGVSDGSFDRVRDREIASVRKAFYELNTSRGDFRCVNVSACGGNGCTFCTPTITFVVAQSQHNIRMTLLEEHHPGKKTNVLSGTCVDDAQLMPFQNGSKIATKNVPREMLAGESSSATPRGLKLFSNIEDTGYDFLLTAHGGLKGTSKPILYRVLLNENVVWRSAENSTALTKQVLQQCTYYMSHTYGTATKAVRAVPVVYYSKRLTMMAMGYLNQLLGVNGNRAHLNKVGIEGDPDGPMGEEDRVKYLRNDAVSSESSPEILSELLPSFSPFEPRLHGDVYKWCASFRPHIAA